VSVARCRPPGLALTSAFTACPPQRFKDPQFERILSAAKCPNSSPDAAVACLRALPWTELRHISIAESDRALQPESYILGSYPWTAGLDGGPENGGFFADEPSAVLQAGDFARVPLLLGDVEDEGTQFAPHNFEDTAALERWIRSESCCTRGLDVRADPVCQRSTLRSPRPARPSSSWPRCWRATRTTRSWARRTTSTPLIKTTAL
jgi:hypothetical protein